VTVERQGCLYCVIQTGIGPDRARKIARAVLSQGTWALVLSTGFACALAPANVGDLIIGTEVCSVLHDGHWIRSGDAVSCSRDEQVRLLSVGQVAGMTVKTGGIVSTPRVISRAKEKQAIRDLTSAAGLDMESAAVASVAHERGIPMAVARTVSDLVGEDLPLDFNLFLRPTSWLIGLWALICHPSSFIGLNRLRTQSRVAADRLADFFEGYVATVEAVRPVTVEIR
jgi:adenosylhomocysteine nucleosidase